MRLLWAWSYGGGILLACCAASSCVVQARSAGMVNFPPDSVARHIKPGQSVFVSFVDGTQTEVTFVKTTQTELIAVRPGKFVGEEVRYPLSQVRSVGYYRAAAEREEDIPLGRIPVPSPTFDPPLVLH